MLGALGAFGVVAVVGGVVLIVGVIGVAGVLYFTLEPSAGTSVAVDDPAVLEGVLAHEEVEVEEELEGAGEAPDEPDGAAAEPVAPDSGTNGPGPPPEQPAEPPPAPEPSSEPAPAPKVQPEPSPGGGSTSSSTSTSKGDRDLLDVPVVVDDVTFTRISHMRAVLAFVNRATREELIEAGVNERFGMVDAILDNRPFRSVQQLGATPKIGNATMRSLADHTAP